MEDKYVFSYFKLSNTFFNTTAWFVGALLIFLTAKAPVKTRYYWEKKIFTNPVAGIAAKKVNNAIGE